MRDARLFGEAPVAPRDAVMAMLPYIAGELARGARLSHITRHMLGLGNGLPGARRFRQILSVDASAAQAGPDLIARAFAELDQAALAVA